MTTLLRPLHVTWRWTRSYFGGSADRSKLPQAAVADDREAPPHLGSAEQERSSESRSCVQNSSPESSKKVASCIVKTGLSVPQGAHLDSCSRKRQVSAEQLDQPHLFLAFHTCSWRKEYGRPGKMLSEARMKTVLLTAAPPLLRRGCAHPAQPQGGASLQVREPLPFHRPDARPVRWLAGWITSRLYALVGQTTGRTCSESRQRITTSRR